MSVGDHCVRMAHRFGCPQEGCSFAVESNDEGEIVHMVRDHAEDRHGMSMSDKDIRKNIQTLA